MVKGKYNIDFELYYVDFNEETENTELIPLSASTKVSAGMYHDPILHIDDVNNEFTIEACCVNLYDNPNFDGEIKKYNIEGKTWPFSALLESNKTYYIVAKFVNNAPSIEIIDAVGEINESDVVPIFTVVRTDNTIRYLSWDSLGAGLPNKLHARLVKTRRFEIESGLSISHVDTDTSGFRISSSGGTVWSGGNKTQLLEADSVVDGIRRYFHTNGSWDYTWTDSYINADQFDNGTNLQTLNNNHYAVIWIYRGVFSDTNYIGYITSTSQYNNISHASEAPIPEAPDIFNSLGTLAAKAIIQKGNYTPIQLLQISSGVGVSGGGGAIPNHNDLPGRTESGAHPMSSITRDGVYDTLTLVNTTDNKEPLTIDLDTASNTNAQIWKKGAATVQINNDLKFTGIAAEASKLENIRTINNVNFDGTQNIEILSKVGFINDGDVFLTSVVSGTNTLQELKLAGSLGTPIKYNIGTGTLTTENISSSGTINAGSIIVGSITATDFNIVHAEDVYTENNHIILRDGAISALVAGQYTGLIAKIPDGTNDAALVFDGDGMARVGDISYNGTIPDYTDTQALATRQDLPTNDALFYWNQVEKRMDSTTILWGTNGIDGIYTISIGGTRKDDLWDIAYDERGSVIGGNKLTWNGTQLDLDILDFNDVDFADQNLLTTSSPTFVGLTVNSLVLKGTSFNTTLTKTEPTAARTITFPNASGTVVLSDGAVTSGFVPTWNGTTGGLLGDGYQVQDSTTNAALSTNAHLVTERDVYYGLIRVNNSTQTRANIIYAPITGGTAGQALRAVAATSAPVWESPADSQSAAAIGTGSTLVTERDIYYGLPKINNSHSYTSSTNIYAPTTGGTLGYMLIGNGVNSAPTWNDLIFNDTVNDRIGIGTTTPTKLLDVNGEARVKNQLTVDSIIAIGNLIIEDTVPTDPNSGYIEIKFVS